MYMAVTRFADMQDANRIYEAGETYPRPGYDATAQRIAELAGSDNRMGYPLIVEVVENCEACEIAPETPVEAVDDAAQDGAEKTAQKGRRSRKKG